MDDHSSISKSVTLGKNVVIEEEVQIGENVTIGHNTVILSGTILEEGVSIGANCVLGVVPGGNKKMRQSDGIVKPLHIHANTRIGNLVSIYAGTEIKEEVFVGDHASIRENVSIGEGSVIGRGAIVELNTDIGKNVTVQTLAYVTGDSILEDYVFLGPCVSMSNDKYMGAKDFVLKGPHLKEGSKIGNNASLLPGVTVGKNVIVGAGSVVTKDLTENASFAGVPARKITPQHLKNEGSTS